MGEGSVADLAILGAAAGYVCSLGLFLLVPSGQSGFSREVLGWLLRALENSLVEVYVKIQLRASMCLLVLVQSGTKLPHYLHRN